jgi:hypothetical protein
VVKADLECGSTTNNAERRQKCGLHGAALTSPARASWCGPTSAVADLPGFEGKKLVSTKGTTPLKPRFAERQREERLLRVDDRRRFA